MLQTTQSAVVLTPEAYRRKWEFFNMFWGNIESKHTSISIGMCILPESQEKGI